jgi:hypothetical protein
MKSIYIRLVLLATSLALVAAFLAEAQLTWGD